MLYVLFDTKKQNYVYTCYGNIGKYKRKYAKELATYYNSCGLKARFIVKSEYAMLLDSGGNDTKTQKDYKALTVKKLLNKLG